MLKTPLIHPDILRALGRAGHGSQILIADGNYPAGTTLGPNAELVSLNLGARHRHRHPGAGGRSLGGPDRGGRGDADPQGRPVRTGRAAADLGGVQFHPG